jgi:hypothetical protein
MYIRVNKSREARLEIPLIYLRTGQTGGNSLRQHHLDRHVYGASSSWDIICRFLPALSELAGRRDRLVLP